MRTIFALMLFIQSVAFADACELSVNRNVTPKANLGIMTLASVEDHDIWLSPDMGDRTAAFNYDYLFEFRNKNGSWYFRLNGKTFHQQNASTKQTGLYSGVWASGKKPRAGQYTVTAYDAPHQPAFQRTLDTVGDSITWWYHGRYLRCLMRNKGLAYDFKGTHTDTFGFQHDGEGGDTTTDILNRMPSIAHADVYLLLAGTNDKKDARQTFQNIVEITQKLHQKNPEATVYVSTLLPRNDAYNPLNQKINNQLRAHTSWCKKCTLIDLGGFVYQQKDWPAYFIADGLHPNDKGYQLISGYLVDRIMH